MYVCIYIYIYIYVYTLSLCLSICISLSLYIYIYIYICIHIISNDTLFVVFTANYRGFCFDFFHRVFVCVLLFDVM